ncbi:MAG: PKD domain-containing protein, partial [Bacteroidota bacterium]
ITTHSPDFVTTPGSFQPVKLNTSRDQPVVMKLSPIYRPAFTHQADNCGGDRFFDSTISNCIWTDSIWTPGSWRWDFGDGSISTERSPIHVYARPGDYAVKLVTGMPYDSITTLVHIAPAGSIAPAAAAHISTDNRAMPGDSVTIPVVLDTPADTLGCRRIAFSIRYDSTMMSLANARPAMITSMLKGTLVEGWTSMVLADRPGFFSLTLDAPLSIPPLQGKGNLLKLQFSTFIKGTGDAQTDSVWRSPLPFDITLYTAQCAPVTAVPGELRFELCGMRQRLIIATMFKYALRPNAPNPVHSATDIEFSLGLDGYTTLMVYDARGEKVETLVDGYLEPGNYAARWDAARHPSGVYHYRLSSGTWSAQGTMLLTK